MGNKHFFFVIFTGVINIIMGRREVDVIAKILLLGEKCNFVLSSVSFAHFSPTLLKRCEVDWNTDMPRYARLDVVRWDSSAGFFLHAFIYLLTVFRSLITRRMLRDLVSRLRSGHLAHVKFTCMKYSTHVREKKNHTLRVSGIVATLCKRKEIYMVTYTTHTSRRSNYMNMVIIGA